MLVVKLPSPERHLLRRQVHFGGRCGLVDSCSCKHGCVPIPDDSLRSVIGESPNEREQHRRSLWEYYDRRVTGRLPGLANAHAYWTGLGVTVEVEDIAAEAAQLERLLRELSAVRFVEVGAGPGTFTGYLAGGASPSTRVEGRWTFCAPLLPKYQ